MTIPLRLHLLCACNSRACLQFVEVSFGWRQCVGVSSWSLEDDSTYSSVRRSILAATKARAECYVHISAQAFSVCAMVLRLSQLRVQNVALFFQALAHGRKSKRACCESLGAPCPGHLWIWTRRCNASNLTQHRYARSGHRVTHE